MHRQDASRVCWHLVLAQRVGNVLEMTRFDVHVQPELVVLLYTHTGRMQ